MARESGIPPQDRPDLLESLVFRVLEAPAGEKDELLANLEAAHPELTGLLRRQLASLEELALLPEVGGGPPQRLGPFELLRRLGGGGMGEVFLARNHRLGRLVALKLIRRELVLHPSAKQRFQREMHAAAALEHPNICTVFSAGEVEHTPFIEMRYYHGRTLAELLRQQRAEKGSTCLQLPAPPEAAASSFFSHARQDPARIAALIEKVARALHAAHLQGLVHRDVKPGNILVTEEGEPVLMDFGLARTEEADQEGLTLTGEPVGTPAYMSPEQVSPGRPVDLRTDVYSLGVTLYECLTLVCPFSGPSRESLFRQIRETPLPNPLRLNRTLAPELRAILETALDKAPERRYRSALDMAEDLRRFRCLEPIAARRAGMLLRGRRWVQRNKVPSAVLALVSAALAATLVLLAQVSALSESRRVLALVGAAAQEERTNPTLSLLLALQAANLEQSPEVFQQLRSSLAASHEKAVARGHENVLWDAAFAAGGTEFLTASQDGTLRTWDLGGKEKVENRIRVADPGHQNRFQLSPDERRLLVATTDGRVTLWDRAGTLPRTLARFEKAAISVSLSRDGRRMAASSFDGSARVFDEAGDLLAELRGHNGPVRSIAIHPGNRELVLTASYDGTAALWDLEGDLERPVLFKGHRAPVHGALFSPDGTRVLTFSWDKTAKLWDLSGQELASLEGHEDYIQAVAWSPRGDRILTVSLDYTARLWGLDGRLVALLDGHTGPVHACAFSPDGELVATGSGDLTIRLWDRKGRQVSVFRGHGHQVNSRVLFSPDGSLLLSAAEDCTARLWEVADLGLPVLFCQGPTVGQVRQIPGREELLTVSTNGWIQTWSLSGRALSSFPSTHGGLIEGLDLSRDGAFLLTASRDGTAKLWDLATKEPLSTMPRVDDWVFSATFDPSGQKILTVVYGTRLGRSRIQLWDRDWQELGLLAPEAFPAPALASKALFLPCGQRIAVAAEDGTIRILDLHGAELGRLTGHQGGIIGLTLSPDGRLLLSSSTDQTARLWDLQAAKLAAPPLYHEQMVIGVAWSPEGDQLATTSRDGTARLWDRTGRVLSILRLHTGAVLGVDFLEGGRHLVTASMDGTVRIWHRFSGDLLAFARGRATRGFSKDERERYGELLGSAGR